MLLLWLGVTAADLDPSERMQFEHWGNPPCDQVRALFDDGTWELTIVGPNDQATFTMPHQPGWYRFQWREGGIFGHLSDGQSYRRRS